MDRLATLDVGWLKPALKYTHDRLGQIGLDRLNDVLPEQVITRPHGRVALAQAYKWGNAFSTMFPGEDPWTAVALRTRLTMCPDIEVALASAACLEEALLNLNETIFREPGIRLEIHRGNPHSRIVVRPPILQTENDLPDVGCRHRAVLALCIIREYVSPSWSPPNIILGGDAVVSSEFWGAPVEYVPRMSSWEIETELLNRPRLHQPKGPPPALGHCCGAHASRAECRGFAHDVADLLREQLRFVGVPSAEGMADMIGLPLTSFKRCLRTAGVTYKEISDQVRFQCAKQLLRAGRCVTEVSREVNYSNPKAFRRAFKRISTLEPAEYQALYHAREEDPDPAKTIRIFRKVV